MGRLFFLFIWLLFSFQSAAQTRKIDSLRKLVLSETSLQKKKKHIADFLSLHRSMNNDTLLHYTKYLKAIAGSDVEMSLTSDFYFALYYSKKAKLDTALKIVEAGISKTRHIPHLNIQFYLLRPALFLKKNNHKEALAGFFTALRLSQQSHDTASQIRSLNGIGWVTLEMGQPQEALLWLTKALNVTHNKQFTRFYDVVYLNMAPCYGMLDNFDSVKFCLKQSFMIAKENDDLLTQANNLALQTNIYMYQGNMAKGLDLIQQAIAIRRVLNDPFYIVSDMAALASIYASMHQPQKGIPVALEAIRIARENNLEAKLPFIYSALAINYEEAKDYKNLAAITRQSLELKDTLYQMAKAEELAELQTRYETEKKEAAIRLLQKESELKDIRNRNHLYIAIALGFIFLTSGMFFYAYQRAKQKRKLAEERAAMELKRLQDVIQIQETERKRISAELHDGVGPVLSAIKLNLGQISYATSDAVKYEKAMQLIDESYRELRNISHQLMPAILLKKGLVSALEEMSGNINSSDILKMVVDSDDPGRRYNNNLEINLYRIIQELINNILKYSGATEAQIQINHESGEVRIMVEDNGRGFDASLLYQSTGNGWNNIASRLNIINGTIEIDSQPGKKGTVVFLAAPAG